MVADASALQLRQTFSNMHVNQQVLGATDGMAIVLPTMIFFY